MSNVKPGKVLRVSPDVWKFMDTKRKRQETNDGVIRRLFGIPPKKGDPEFKKHFILPRSGRVFDTIEEAKGEALIQWVKQGKKEPKEKPIPVLEVV